MATNTTNLGLYKADPSTDGNNNFNIKTMMNDNWDKIDADSKSKNDYISSLAGVGRTTETVKGNADALNAHISDNEQSFANLNNIINNLNTNDIEARREILDIKLKLDEDEVIDFISKTGIGFFDLFKDTSNIDTANSTASIANADATFSGDKILQFLTQAFEEFKNVELALYDLNRESIKADVDVNNSNTIEATVSPDSIATGDKFYLNGEIYTVNSIELEE